MEKQLAYEASDLGWFGWPTTATIEGLGKVVLTRKVIDQRENELMYVLYRVLNTNEIVTVFND